MAPVRIHKQASPMMASNTSLSPSQCMPYEELPERLQKVMQKLKRYKDSVNNQACRVVDIAVSEWQKAEARAALTAAKLAKEAQKAAELGAFDHCSLQITAGAKEPPAPVAQGTAPTAESKQEN